MSFIKPLIALFAAAFIGAAVVACESSTDTADTAAAAS